jgi:hypothetical protein
MDQGADPTIGEPSALDATKIFRQEKFEEMFVEVSWLGMEVGILLAVEDAYRSQ